MAEVHIIGTLIGASEFPSMSLSCKYSFITGDNWKCLEGDEWGQTHVDLPKVNLNYLNTKNPQLCIWSHPLDLHYATTTTKGWPKLVVQVYHQDMFGRNELVGYGFTHIPTSPGLHSVEVVTWRPIGGVLDRLYSYFLGATPQLKNLDVITNASDRFRLETMTMGKVHAEISIITRNFDTNGVVL